MQFTFDIPTVDLAAAPAWAYYAGAAVAWYFCAGVLTRLAAKKLFPDGYKYMAWRQAPTSSPQSVKYETRVVEVDAAARDAAAFRAWLVSPVVAVVYLAAAAAWAASAGVSPPPGRVTAHALRAAALT